ncbi:hypothetical protein C8R46DRAFT_1313852 [Mycena filopes]|nr:hypothetical protein C8R46DRAFT_1313852 [Mycena filopes]
MPHAEHRVCPCGCEERHSNATIRRHLRDTTKKSVLVAQQHNFREQRLRRLWAEARALNSSDTEDDADLDGDVDMAPPEDHSNASDAEEPELQSNGAAESNSDDDEEDEPLGADLGVAPWLQGLSALDRLEEVFNVDAAHRGHKLTADKMNAIRAHNYKVDVDLGARAYDKLPRAFPELEGLPSRQKLRTQIAFLSGVKPIAYDCCVGSCCCFTDAYAALDRCPCCNEPRRDSAGRPRNSFHYLPLIPRLVNLFQDDSMAQKLDYRDQYQSVPGKTSDIFDGSHYQRLRKTKVTIENETLPHKFFSQ